MQFECGLIRPKLNYFEKTAGQTQVKLGGWILITTLHVAPGFAFLHRFVGKNLKTMLSGFSIYETNMCSFLSSLNCLMGW